MTRIPITVINENPDSITPTFEAEYAISFEAANPDGNPAHTAIGGPGVLGGPEYINLLQRTQTIIQKGYRYETFDLPQYPNHTFTSFINGDTGVKKVVAFLKSGAPEPADLSPVISAHEYATTLVTGINTTASPAGLPGTYTWGITGGTITGGQGTDTLEWTAGVAGPAVFTLTYTNLSGVAAPASTPATTTIVAVPNTTITSTTPVANTTAGLTATVPVQAGCTFLWTITDNGTVTSGDTTRSLVWASTTAGTATLHVTVTNAAGTAATDTKVITVSA